MFIVMPIALFLVRVLGLYAIVNERACHVYVLFGKVIGMIDEPGLHFLPLRLGLSRVPGQLARAAPHRSTCGSTRSTCAASR